MDGPHVCQRCSGTFALASSLRTHAAHVHGERLQAFLASQHSGNHGDMTGDYKSNMIKLEWSDAVSVNTKTSVTDTQEHVDEIHGRNVTNTSNSKIQSCDHGNTAGDLKPDMVKMEVCDYEVDSVQSDNSVTDKQPDTNQLSDVHCEVVAERATMTEPGSRGVIRKVSENTVSTSSGSGRSGGVHTKEKPYVCNVCEKRFAYPSQLKFHKLSLYGGEKPYACNTCGRSFLYPSQLKYHELYHTGDKPYICNICGLSHSRNHDLSHHIRSDHGGKPYACDVCKESFDFYRQLNKHSCTLPKSRYNTYHPM